MAAKNLAQFPRRQPNDDPSQPMPQRASREPSGLAATPPDFDALAVQFLRSLHVLLRSVRLYHQHHPGLIDSLKVAGQALDAALGGSDMLRFGLEDNGLVVSKQPSGSGHPLGDGRGDLKALAEMFWRARIRSLTFVPHTQIDELLQFARAIDMACRAQGTSLREDWASRLREYRITGIRVNQTTERPSEPINFAGLLEALLGSSLDRSASDDLAAKAAPEQFRTALRLLWASARRLDHVRMEAAQEAARAIRAELSSADELLRSLLMRGVVLEPPHESESLGAYLTRVADALSVDYARSEFFARRLRPAEVRMFFSQLRSERDGHPESDASLEPLVERFWISLPARERTRLLASPDAWCLPQSLLRSYLEGLIAAAESRRAEASRREARRALADFARCLESEEDKARRAVASGLLEMKDVLERIWPCAQLADLGKNVVEALHREVSPGISNLLEQLTQTLATLALARGECAEVEAILMEIDQPPAESDEERLAGITRRIVGSEEWLLLVDLALANRPLDPALPRLLRRDPERLLDRLRLLLTSSAGSSALPAMARLVRGAGEPVLGALETHLLEPRRQRVATAIKLLSAAAPDRLIVALPRAFSSWDWSLQDLAVTELSRQSAPALRLQVAQAFLALLRDAQLLVAPGMIDHIGIVGDASAVPRLIEIAGGEIERFGDVFIRIKAIEALGRMKAASAATLLRNLVRNRSGLTYVEPAGLRSAAEDALALIEDRAGSLTLRLPTSTTSTPPFAQPRRYLRVVLPDPLEAKLDGPRAQSARVRSIALGGALLESSAPFALGESVRIEIHAGFERIRATAVVRSVSAKGCGIEFVHMKQEDREKLRRRINKLLD
jgi:PilZ domain-containing protein